MSSPFFSIIIPTYGAESFVAECLESLRRQTFPDFEILVLDGGSTDKTVEVVSRLAPAFVGRLSLRSEKDAGVFAAMNKGIRLARGQWLYFLGSDDRLHQPDTLRCVKEFISRQSSGDLVYGDVILRSDTSRYAGAFDLDRLLFEKNICHQAIFYRRTVFEKIGDYNLRYRIWADWDLNIRCFQHPAFVCHHLDLIVAHYNDTRGVSIAGDPELQKRLPVFIKKDDRLIKILQRKAGEFFRKFIQT